MRYLILALLLIFSFSTPHMAEARSGCCSHHGGVMSNGCGCNDGTPLSATCAPYYSCSTQTDTSSEYAEDTSSGYDDPQTQTYDDPQTPSSNQDLPEQNSFIRSVKNIWAWLFSSLPTPSTPAIQKAVTTPIPQTTNLLLLTTPTLSPQSQTAQQTVSSWPDLENKYFPEAKAKGWTSLVITNELNEKHFYRLEKWSYVQKTTLEESEQPYSEATQAQEEFDMLTAQIKKLKNNGGNGNTSD